VCRSWSGHIHIPSLAVWTQLDFRNVDKTSHIPQPLPLEFFINKGSTGEKNRNTCNTQTRLREDEIHLGPRLRDLLSDIIPRSPLAKNMKATHKDRRDGRFRREMMFTHVHTVRPRGQKDAGRERILPSPRVRRLCPLEKYRLQKIQLRDPLTDVSPYESSRQSLIFLAVYGDCFWSGSRPGWFTVPLCTLEHVWRCCRC
jgi:hypothetical protein